MNEKTEWYYVEDSDRIGPLNEDEFDALVNSGKISFDTLVWNKTFSDWKSFGSISRKVAPVREKVPDFKTSHVEKPAELTKGLVFLRIAIIVLTIHQLYLSFRDLYFIKYLFDGNLPPTFYFYTILGFIITVMWCLSLFRFIKKRKNFVSTFKITTFLSCVPLMISIIYFKNFAVLLSLRNFAIIYIIMAILSFTYLSNNSNVKEVFINE